LFAEIDKYVASGKQLDVDAGEAAEGAAWLQAIEEENAGDMTPERLAALEKAAADAVDSNSLEEMSGSLLDVVAAKARLDEESSPTAGRRFTRS
ncbi:MAG TPA: 4-hydroxy-3-methylbut-2-en-1-yl diphosphate synthase, partial [Conexibacter sp.]|nr:4-hydroxy-3-methylbut-2-en-1-yl diphosphate synthase [Conexibacter sp.]